MDNQKWQIAYLYLISYVLEATSGWLGPKQIQGPPKQNTQAGRETHFHVDKWFLISSAVAWL